MTNNTIKQYQFIQKLFLRPPMERQLDEIASVMEAFNFNQINYHNLGLDITNEYFSADVKDLHQLIVQHMQYNYYSTTHKIIKQKGRILHLEMSFFSIEYQKLEFVLLSIYNYRNLYQSKQLDSFEGQVDVYDGKEDGNPLYTFKYGDIFTDREIMKAEKKQMIFVFHPHTHAGQTKYEDIQETLEFSNATPEEKNNKFLQLIYLFQKLNLQHFKEVIHHLTFKEYLNGETVFEQTDPADSFFIIKSGEFIVNI